MHFSFSEMMSLPAHKGQQNGLLMYYMVFGFDRNLNKYVGQLSESFVS